MRPLKLPVIIVLSLLFSFGCQVNDEKIELWKSTQKGPKKLAGVLIDTGMDLKLRAKASIALIDIKQYALLEEAFTKIEAGDADKVILAAVPILTDIIDKGGDGDSLTPEQIAAKDGLYILYKYSVDESKKAVENALVDWCAKGNFKSRSMAGYNIKVIVSKVGTPALIALAKRLTVNEPYVKSIADLIRQSKDEEALKLASGIIAEQLKNNPGKFSETHLMAAAVIGGDSVGDTLVDFATDPKISEELKRYALRAYSVAMDEKNITGTKHQLEKLVKMAEDTSFDKFQREETYMTIAQIAQPESAAAFKKLLNQKDFFWNMVGVRCLLRLDAEKYLPDALSVSAIAKSKEQINELIDLVSKFSDIKKSTGKVFESGSAFAKGIVIYAIAKIGNKGDIMILEKVLSSKQKLPKGFKNKSVKDAAKEVINLLKKG